MNLYGVNTAESRRHTNREPLADALHTELVKAVGGMMTKGVTH
jgi:hypothetical protein